MENQDARVSYRPGRRVAQGGTNYDNGIPMQTNPPLSDMDALKEQWLNYCMAVGQASGSTEQFRVVNQTLGFNIAKTLPNLVDHIEFLRGLADSLQLDVATLRQQLRDEGHRPDA